MVSVGLSQNDAHEREGGPKSTYNRLYHAQAIGDSYRECLGRYSYKGFLKQHVSARDTICPLVYLLSTPGLLLCSKGVFVQVLPTNSLEGLSYQ